MRKEELIRDEDYTEEEAEKMILQNKLDKANERIEELEDSINTAVDFIKKDLIVNERWRKEESTPIIRRIIDTLIKYDNCLLQALKSDE